MIRHEEGAAFVGSPNVASLYNQHQLYRREKIDDIDATDWIVLSDDVLSDAIGAFDESIADRPTRPFRRAWVPLDARTYLDQRRLFEACSTLDELAVEESALDIAVRVIGSAYRSAPPPRKSADRAEALKSLIAATPAANAPLRDLARALDASPFHLCRIFRASTGMSITAYRHSLRLRLALELLRDTAADVTDVALRLGYSSHSHFTAAFRRHFGITPSRFRDSRDRGALEARPLRHRFAASAAASGPARRV
jgi:AraC-like DNA-binding protein